MGAKDDIKNLQDDVAEGERALQSIMDLINGASSAADFGSSMRKTIPESAAKINMPNPMPTGAPALPGIASVGTSNSTEQVLNKVIGNTGTTNLPMVPNQGNSGNNMGAQFTGLVSALQAVQMALGVNSSAVSVSSKAFNASVMGGASNLPIVSPNTLPTPYTGQQNQNTFPSSSNVPAIFGGHGSTVVDTKQLPYPTSNLPVIGGNNAGPVSVKVENASGLPSVLNNNNAGLPAIGGGGTIKPSDRGQTAEWSWAKGGYLGLAPEDTVHGRMDISKGLFAGVLADHGTPGSAGHVPPTNAADWPIHETDIGVGQRFKRRISDTDRDVFLGSMSTSMDFLSEQGHAMLETKRTAYTRKEWKNFSEEKGLSYDQYAAGDVGMAVREHRSRRIVSGTAMNSLGSFLQSHQEAGNTYSSSIGFNGGMFSRAGNSPDHIGGMGKETMAAIRKADNILVNRDSQHIAAADLSRNIADVQNTLGAKLGENESIRTLDGRLGSTDPNSYNQRTRALSAARERSESLTEQARTIQTGVLRARQPNLTEHDMALAVEESMRTGVGLDAGAGRLAAQAKVESTNYDTLRGNLFRGVSAKHVQDLRDNPETAHIAEAIVASQTMERGQAVMQQGGGVTGYERNRQRFNSAKETGGQAVAMNMQNMQWALMLGFSGPVFQALSQMPNEASYRAVTPLYSGASNLLGMSALSREFESFPQQAGQQMMNMQTRTNTMSSLLGSNQSARQAVGKALDVSKEQPIKFDDAMEVLTAMSTFPGTRKATAGPQFQSKMFETVQLLSMLAPEQGTGGALFAVREMLGGQYRSLQTRFNISPEMLAGYGNTTTSKMKQQTGAQMIDNTHTALTNLFGGPDILMKRSAQMDIQMSNIGDILTSSIVRPATMDKQSDITGVLNRLMGKGKDKVTPGVSAGDDSLGLIEQMIPTQQAKTIKESVLTTTMNEQGIEKKKGATYESVTSALSATDKAAFKESYDKNKTNTVTSMYGTGAGSLALITSSIGTALDAVMKSFNVGPALGKVTSNFLEGSSKRLETYENTMSTLADTSDNKGKRQAAAKDLAMGFIDDLSSGTKNVGGKLGGGDIKDIVAKVADFARTGSEVVFSPVANMIMAQTVKTAASLPSMMVGGAIDSGVTSIAGSIGSVFSGQQGGKNNAMSNMLGMGSVASNAVAWGSLMSARSTPWRALQTFTGMSSLGASLDKAQESDTIGSLKSFGEFAAITAVPRIVASGFKGYNEYYNRQMTGGNTTGRMSTMYRNIPMAAAGALGLAGGIASAMEYSKKDGDQTIGAIGMAASAGIAFAPAISRSFSNTINAFSTADAIRTAYGMPANTGLEKANILNRGGMGTAFGTQGVASNMLRAGVIGAGMYGAHQALQAYKESNDPLANEYTKYGKSAQAAGGLALALGMATLGSGGVLAPAALAIGGIAAVGGFASSMYGESKKTEKAAGDKATELKKDREEKIQDAFGTAKTERVDSISRYFDRTVKSYSLEKTVAPEKIAKLRDDYKKDVSNREDDREAIFKTMGGTALDDDNIFTDKERKDNAKKSKKEVEESKESKKSSITNRLLSLSETIAPMLAEPATFAKKDSRNRIIGEKTHDYQLSDDYVKDINEKIKSTYKNTGKSEVEVQSIQQNTIAKIETSMKAAGMSKEALTNSFNQDFAPGISQRIKEQAGYSEQAIIAVPKAIQSVDQIEEFRDKTIQAYSGAQNFMQGALTGRENRMQSAALLGGNFAGEEKLGKSNVALYHNLLKQDKVDERELSNPQFMAELMVQAQLYGTPEQIDQIPKLASEALQGKIKNKLNVNAESTENLEGGAVRYEVDDQGRVIDKSPPIKKLTEKENAAKEDEATNFVKKLQEGTIQQSSSPEFLEGINTVRRFGTTEERGIMSGLVSEDLRKQADPTYETTVSSKHPGESAVEREKRTGTSTLSPSDIEQQQLKASQAQATVAADGKPVLPTIPGSSSGAIAPGAASIPGGVGITIGGGNTITIGGGSSVSAAGPGSGAVSSASTQTLSKPATFSTQTPTDEFAVDMTKPEAWKPGAKAAQNSTLSAIANGILDVVTPSSAYAADIKTPDKATEDASKVIGAPREPAPMTYAVDIKGGVSTIETDSLIYEGGVEDGKPKGKGTYWKKNAKGEKGEELFSGDSDEGQTDPSRWYNTTAEKYFSEGKVYNNKAAYVDSKLSEEKLTTAEIDQKAPGMYGASAYGTITTDSLVYEGSIKNNKPHGMGKWFEKDKNGEKGTLLHGGLSQEGVIQGFGENIDMGDGTYTTTVERIQKMYDKDMTAETAAKNKKETITPVDTAASSIGMGVHAETPKVPKHDSSLTDEEYAAAEKMTPEELRTKANDTLKAANESVLSDSRQAGGRVTAASAEMYSKSDAYNRMANDVEKINTPDDAPFEFAEGEGSKPSIMGKAYSTAEYAKLPNSADIPLPTGDASWALGSNIYNPFGPTSSVSDFTSGKTTGSTPASASTLLDSAYKPSGVIGGGDPTSRVSDLLSSLGSVETNKLGMPTVGGEFGVTTIGRGPFAAEEAPGASFAAIPESMSAASQWAGGGAASANIGGAGVAVVAGSDSLSGPVNGSDKGTTSDVMNVGTLTVMASSMTVMTGSTSS